MSRHEILDHGYIKAIEHWGSDERIVMAARMSTGKGFLGWGPNCPNAPPGDEAAHDLYECEVGGMGESYPGIACRACNHAVDPKPGDEKLLRYLYENRHDTPFEMAGLVVEVRAPLFVFREWHRHRVPWSYNEASARYAPLPALDYLPAGERLARGGGHLTKQAGAHEGKLDADVVGQFLSALKKWQEDGEHLYQYGLKNGVPKEIARLAMSVGRYSTMRASANLRGWLHFLGLRSSPKAQEEIRLYAEAAAKILRVLFPRTMALHDGGSRR